MERRASIAGRAGSRCVTMIASMTLSGCGIPGLVSGRGSPGDGDLDSTISALQAIHGPQECRDITAFLAPPIEYDFNRDGRGEILFLISDRGMGQLRVDGVEDLREGVCVAGFLLFTEVEGRWWPVYYFYDHERASLHLDPIYGPNPWDEKAMKIWTEGLVVDSDKGGRELTWFWHPAHPGWPYSFWATSLRRWDEERHAYTGLRRSGLGPIHVVYGAK